MSRSRQTNRQNPARETSAFVEEARALLLERDPESTQIFQDLVLAQGETLGTLGRQLGFPDDVKEVLRRKSTLMDDSFVIDVGGFEVTANKQWPETVVRNLPAYWASYLINGDASGMDDDEVAQVDAYLKRTGLGDPSDVGDETWFSSYNDAGTMAGDVAAYTFIDHSTKAPEGAWWQIIPATTTKSKDKFLATVSILYRGLVFNFPGGRRFDSESDAIDWSSRVAWQNAALLKMNRDAADGALVLMFTSQPVAGADVRLGPLHGLEIPDALFTGDLVGPGEMKENPKKRREQTVAEQMAENRISSQVIELLESDDPNALDIARDLLLKHEVKLANFAHRMALSGSSNFATGTLGWAADFPSGTTGELVLSRTKEVDDSDYIAVGWTIWHLRPETVRRIRADNREAMPYEGEITVNYLGSSFAITDHGGAFDDGRSGFGHLKRGRKLVVARPSEEDYRVPLEIVDPQAVAAMDAMRRVGPIGGSTLEVAERRTIDIAWQIAKIIKKHHGISDVEMAKAIAHEVQPPPSKHTPAALINPARPIPNPNRFRPNPPWVTEALGDAFESIASQVRADWLPKLKDVRGSGNDLVGSLTEYGCGAYGCVLPTLDPGVVLKVTTDETEADFASQLAIDLVAPICVEYFQAMSLAARHEHRPIYLLWREAADDVGALAKVLGSAANDLVDDQHEIAKLAYKALFEKRLDQAKIHLREWHVKVDAMGTVRELRGLATGLLEVYRKQKIFFGDIHAGNLGRVFRGGAAGEWVVTDPGHVAVLR